MASLHLLPARRDHHGRPLVSHVEHRRYQAHLRSSPAPPPPPAPPPAAPCGAPPTPAVPRHISAPHPARGLPGSVAAIVAAPGRHFHQQAHWSQLMANATPNPSVVSPPTSCPPCSKASGIIVSASIVSIAPAAKARTRATASGEAP